MQGIPHRLGIGLEVQPPGNSQLTIGWLPMFRYAYQIIPTTKILWIHKDMFPYNYILCIYIILYTSKRDSSLNGHFWDLPKKLYNWFKQTMGRISLILNNPPPEAPTAQPWQGTPGVWGRDPRGLQNRKTRWWLNQPLWKILYTRETQNLHFGGLWPIYWGPKTFIFYGFGVQR